MSRIVSVYSPRRRSVDRLDMAEIRWHRMSAALADLGHTVHMASAELGWRFRRRMPDSPGLSVVPIAGVDWDTYDVVKTVFHAGFETLEKYGGAHHPLIISKLGSVVGSNDMPGVYFYGRQRERLYATQQRIVETSKFAALLSEPAFSLWRQTHGDKPQLLLVPGAADAVIPLPNRDPYPKETLTRCLFAGNFYSSQPGSQPEAHREIALRLNRLGALLIDRGARLFVLGPGDHRSLDARHVSYCGAIPYERSWDYLHFATVGIVVAAGPFMHNNESTKIYSYLRAGLPVVSEAGFPNDDVVLDSGLGCVVENGNLSQLADTAIEAANADWDRERGVQFILGAHTWHHRAAIYDRLLQDLGVGASRRVRQRISWNQT
ncbi:MAG: hypothetical protein ABI556_07485 [Gemmatimonadales bacterium]